MCLSDQSFPYDDQLIRVVMSVVRMCVCVFLVNPFLMTIS